MGSLFYGGTRLRIEIDDVRLQALEMITVSKIRRNEPFLLSWRDSGKVGDGRSSVLINPAIELHFKYSGSRVPATDRETLENFARASNSSSGIHIDTATLLEPPLT